MSEMSVRLRTRIMRDFPEPGSADEVMRLVLKASQSERIQAAIVLAAGGDLHSVQRGVQLAAIDWRDVLMTGGLADDDWSSLLDRELGPGREASTPEQFNGEL